MVEWTPFDIGKCHVTYTIQYENQTGIVGITSKIADTTHAWCEKMYCESTAIKMSAVYGGNVGAKSSTIPLNDNAYSSERLSGEFIFVIFLTYTVLITFSRFGEQRKVNFKSSFFSKQ